MIRILLGLSVAIIAVFSIGMAEFAAGKALFEDYRYYVAGGIGVMGVLILLIGMVRHSNQKSAQTGEAANDIQYDLITDARYWGGLTVVLGIITVFIMPFRTMKETVKASAPVKKVVAAVAEAVPTPEPEPPPNPEIPKLKMQGVFMRQSRPFAIINGESYTVGDHIGEVTIKSIETNRVHIEVAGLVTSIRMD